MLRVAKNERKHRKSVYQSLQCRPTLAYCHSVSAEYVRGGFDPALYLARCIMIIIGI